MHKHIHENAKMFYFKSNIVGFSVQTALVQLMCSLYVGYFSDDAAGHSISPPSQTDTANIHRN